MKYNFDKIINRRNTNSIKHDFALEKGKPENIIPLWVADMDFQTPPEVTEALIKTAQHGIFGYTETKQDYFEALYQWFDEGFNWAIQPSWLVKNPGVVYAINLAIRALTAKGDAVLIQQPVYHPFSHSIIANQRTLINNPLKYNDGKYSIDFADFEEKIVANNVKLFLFSSPHNPVGRVWSKEELTRLGDICVRHQVLVIADEIHADFVYPGFKHTVFASLKPEFADITITCTAPSKTFNLAGLQVSNIFISNKTLKNKYVQEMIRSGCSSCNTMGLVACQAAYTYGRPWLEELIQYLSGNLSFLRTFLTENLPQIKLIEPEGTYLVWLDFNELGLREEELDYLLVHKAGLWLNPGTIFGPEGQGFQRINIACPQAILEQALTQLAKAVHWNS
jgi:cystathionine beta-lyase